MRKKLKLTKEEKEIEKSLGSSEWEEASDELKGKVLQAAKAGMAARKREARVNIRMSQGDVDLIRQRANEEGLGYQTLMSSVLHKFATGLLVDRNIINQVASEIASKVQHGLPRKRY